MPMDIGPWTPPSSNGERRLSNSSDGSAGSGYSKATSDSTEYLPTRTTKVIPGKPAANPLQFVKVGPCELYRKAQEQLKKAEAVSKSKEHKSEDREDWQSNLDNWKGLRRKRVEHIIERCVEVKKMENEVLPGARAKRKTFNEMLEERAGRRRLCPLTLYTEEEVTDLSDLGIGTSSTKSSLSEDCDTHSIASDGMDLDKNHSDVENISNCGFSNRKLESSSNEYDTCTTTTISSPEPEEYTYESAIEGYKSRIISNTNTKILELDRNKISEKNNGDIKSIRTAVSTKIDEKVNSFQNKLESNENNSEIKKDLGKLEILRKRELFEKESTPELLRQKSVEIGPKKSIKERLSSLEKFTEETQSVNKSLNDINKVSVEVRPLKDRLSSLKNVFSEENAKKKISQLHENHPTRTIQQRVSSLQKQVSSEDDNSLKLQPTEINISLKQRLTSLEAIKNTELSLQHNKIDYATYSETDDQQSLENQMQTFCRSLDSLEINEEINPSSFDRIQSMEDLSRVNTSPSDVETEDSGVHTANGSCSVSQADEHADITELHTDHPEHNTSTESEENVSSQITAIHRSQSNLEDELSKHDDTESISNFTQANSQQDEDTSVTEEITEIHLDKNEDDTFKSLELQDTSVSLNELATAASEEENAVFEGKMLIQFNMNEMWTNSNSTSINNTNTQTVLDALELAFEEMDSEENINESLSQITINNNITTKDTKPIENGTTSNHDKDQDNDQAVEDTTTPVYENIEIFYQNGGVLDPNVLDAPVKVLEPPKEKPPPPPVDEDDGDELLGNGNFKSVNSTRRIKKEIHNKRNSFLGIEGQMDDSYLDAVELRQPRPDITSFLQEATKIEKQLYKRTLSHDMDRRLLGSRDSGVDLQTAHSRQNSEPYATVSDEEDTKHRVTFNEIVNDKALTQTAPTHHGSFDDLNREVIDKIDRNIAEQQENGGLTNETAFVDGIYDDVQTKEVLRFERELLQLEQEELRRQRDNLIFRESQIRKQQTNKQNRQPDTVKIATNKPIPTQRLNKNVNSSYRHSMPNLNGDNGMLYAEAPINQQEVRETVLPRSTINPVAPPPLPRAPQQTQRPAQIPSGEYVNLEPQQRPIAQPRPKPIVDGQIQGGGNYHPMSRHTLQALSAAPSPKLISGQEWLHSRKPKLYHNLANYNQHWLVQEAEQRRLEDQRLRLHLQKQQMQHNPQQLSTQPQVITQQQLLTQPQVQMRSQMKNKQNRHSYHDYVNVNKMQAYSNGIQSPPNVPVPTSPPVVPPLPREESSGKVLSVSGRRKCSHCNEELGRGAAMIIESLGLCYHVWCFSCSACGVPLGDGRNGTDVRVRHNALHCHHCYSHDDGSKLSQV